MAPVPTFVKRVEQYRFSSFGLYNGAGHPGVKVCPDLYTQSVFKHGIEGRETWLNLVNQELSENDQIILKKCFMRSVFTYSKRALHSMGTGTSLII